MEEAVNTGLISSIVHCFLEMSSSFLGASFSLEDFFNVIISTPVLLFTVVIRIFSLSRSDKLSQSSNLRKKLEKI